MDQQSIRELADRAIQVRKMAYAPYSKFQVGAALLTKDGQIIVGCNCENGVLGLSICAERVAISSAITRGIREFSAIAIAASPVATPCGPCRQFMVEFGADLKVICVDAQQPGALQTYQLNELLPAHFELRAWPGREN